MHNKQFLIDPWKNEIQQARQANQNSLRKFVQFIDKANFESFRLKKQNEQFNDRELQIKRAQKSYLSVKDSKRRMKTEQERVKLRSFVQKNTDIKAQTPKHVNKMEIGQQSKVKASCFNHVIALAQRANFQQQKSIRFVNKQRQCFKSPHRQKRSSSTNQFSRQQQCLVRRNLTKKQIKPNKNMKEEKAAYQGKSSQTITNEDNVKKLKSFFFKTVDHEKNDRSPNHSQQKKFDVKLKNMLQKSNKKKKKLEELFKPKQCIDQTNIERTINANKIYQIQTIDSTRTLQNKSILSGQSIKRLPSFLSIRKDKHKRKQS